MVHTPAPAASAEANTIIVGIKKKLSVSYVCASGEVVHPSELIDIQHTQCLRRLMDHTRERQVGRS